MGLFGLTILDQLQRLHQPHPADVADARVLFPQLLQALAQVAADLGGIVPEVSCLRQMRRAAEARVSDALSILRT